MRDGPAREGRLMVLAFTAALLAAAAFGVFWRAGVYFIPLVLAFIAVALFLVALRVRLVRRDATDRPQHRSGTAEPPLRRHVGHHAFRPPVRDHGREPPAPPAPTDTPR